MGDLGWRDEHVRRSSVLCVILIGRVRESAGQHFSSRARRGVGWRRVERRRGKMAVGLRKGRSREGGRQMRESVYEKAD